MSKPAYWTLDTHTLDRMDSEGWQGFKELRSALRAGTQFPGDIQCDVLFAWLRWRDQRENLRQVLFYGA